MSRASTLSGFTTAIGQPTNLNVGVLTCQALSSNDVTFSDDLSLKNLNATSSVNTPGLIVTGISTLGTNGSDSVFINGGTDTHATSTLRFRNNAGNVNYGFIQNRSDNITLGTNSTDPIFFETNNTQRVAITPDGKLGVGRTDPQATLQVGAGFDAGNPQQNGTLLISADNGLHNYIRFTNGGSNETHYPAGIWYAPDGRMELRAASGASTSNEEQLVLAKNSNIGIGTDNPATLLHMVGTTPTFRIADGSTQVSEIKADTTATMFRTLGSHALLFGTNDTEQMRINSDGDVLMGGTNDATADFVFEKGTRATFYRSLYFGATDAAGSNLDLNTDGSIDAEGRANIGSGSLDDYALAGFTNSATYGGVYAQNNNSSGNLFTGNENTTEVFKVTATGLTQTRGNIRCDSAGGFGDPAVELINDGRGVFKGSLKIGGTAAANQIDEYEVGTWTPAPSAGSFSGTVDATYVRVGNLVTVNGVISGSTDNTTNSAYIVTNLPFNVAYRSVGACFSGNTNPIADACYGNPTTNDMYFYVSSTSTYAALKYSNLTASSNQIFFGMSYYTS